MQTRNSPQDLAFTSAEALRDGNADLDGDVIKRALHSANNLITITDPRLEDNPIVWVNDFFCEFTGYERHEVIGRNCRFLQGEERDQPERHKLRECIDDNRFVHVMIRNYKKDGTLFINDLYVSPVTDEHGHLNYFIGVQNDVTEKQAQRDRVIGLEREIHETAENERERFGMDLHDGLGQSLTGARLLLEAMRTEMADTNSSYIGSVERIVEILTDSQREAREMARGLNPIDATPYGLAAALRALADGANANRGDNCPIVTAFVEAVPFRDRRQPRHLYRIVQEALNNALKHAHAQNVRITLHQTPLAVMVEVQDDGCGFEVPVLDRVPGDEHVGRNGMGLNGMRFRSDLIGAQLTIRSIPGVGTTVRCTLPEEPENEAQHRRTAEV